MGVQSDSFTNAAGSGAAPFPQGLTSSKASSFYAYNSSTQASISTGSWVLITLDTEDHDDNSDFASSTFTAPENGVYYLSSALRFTSTTTPLGSFGVSFYINGGTKLINFGSMSGDAITTSASYVVSASPIIKLNAADTVQIRVFTSTSGTDIIGTSERVTFFSGHKLIST